MPKRTISKPVRVISMRLSRKTESYDINCNKTQMPTYAKMSALRL